jgi:hypothetical protein
MQPLAGSLGPVARYAGALDVVPMEATLRPLPNRNPVIDFRGHHARAVRSNLTDRVGGEFGQPEPAPRRIITALR